MEDVVQTSRLHSFKVRSFDDIFCKAPFTFPVLQKLPIFTEHFRVYAIYFSALPQSRTNSFINTTVKCLIT